MKLTNIFYGHVQAQLQTRNENSRENRISEEEFRKRKGMAMGRMIKRKNWKSKRDVIFSLISSQVKNICHEKNDLLEIPKWKNCVTQWAMLFLKCVHIKRFSCVCIRKCNLFLFTRPKWMIFKYFRNLICSHDKEKEQNRRTTANFCCLIQSK